MDCDTAYAIRVSAPLFLLGATKPCDRCKASNHVVALACLNLEDPAEEIFRPHGDGFLLTHVSDLPDRLLALIRQRYANYHLIHCFLTGVRSFATVCGCGRGYSDRSIERLFFELAARQPGDIAMNILPIAGTLRLQCGYGSSHALGHLLQRRLGSAQGPRERAQAGVVGAKAWATAWRT